MAKRKHRDNEPEPIPDSFQSGDGPNLNQMRPESFQLSQASTWQTKVDFALCAICTGSPTRIVTRELSRLTGVTERTAEDIVRAALKILVLDMDNPKKVLRLISVAWYQLKLMDPETPIDLQFKAREKIDTLLGLREPISADDDDDDDEDDSKRQKERRKDEISKILPTLPNATLRALADTYRLIKARVENGSDTDSAQDQPKKTAAGSDNPAPPAPPEPKPAGNSQIDMF